MHVRLISDSKIVLRSECERVCVVVCTRLSLCGPVMDPVMDSPDDRWDPVTRPWV